MISRDSNGTIEIFSTCPPSSTVDARTYVQQVRDVARWSEEAGCRGILVYTDNSLVDPWLVSQIVIESTHALCPLVAVQPVYMHPYSVAKMVASLGHLYGRRVYLNMVAGGFKNDLAALNDPTPHDRRYERLVEYTTVIQRLLSTESPVTLAGECYRVQNLRMTPALSRELFPGITLSGSSEAGVAAAKALGAVAIQYPESASEYAAKARDPEIRYGIRVGIIAREKEESAWEIAHQRFPEDRKGQLTHQLAMKTSDSSWHRQLSELGEQAKQQKSPYWLVPFENYKTFCPYLVGSYEQVAAELTAYIAAGNTSFILDIPAAEEELHHTSVVFSSAVQQAASLTD